MTYKRSATWSKPDDEPRNALVRSQYDAVADLTPDQVTSLFAGCSSAMQRNASRVLDALGDFVRVGLDDLDAAADGVASLGISLASDGVKNMDYDSMLIGILTRAEAALGSRWDGSAKQRWASVVDVFCEMCRSSAPATPKSKITEPKKTKKSYTGGYYKKFQISMGWKKPPEKIPFNLPADASDSLASPGPGATPRHVDRAPAGAGRSRSIGRDGAAAGGSVGGPVAAVQNRSPARMEKDAARERGVERAFAMFARASAVAMIAAAAKFPEASVGLLRAALMEAKMGLLACVALLFALRPYAFSRTGVVACVFVAAWAIIGHGYGVGGVRDLSFATGPVCDAVPAACENGVTRWMMLVIDGSGAKGGKK